MRIFRKGRGQTHREGLHGTDHLAQELGHYKVTFSTKLKRTGDYDKGTPIFINFYVIGSIMSMLKHARST